MKKWEDSFKKPMIDHDNANPCWCLNNQGLFIPNRQLSAIVAGLLFLFFCTFMTGYFLGKKYTIELTTQKLTADLIDDKVAASRLLESSATLPDVTASTEKDVNNGIVFVESHESAVSSVASATINQDIVIATQKEQKYYAQLIGFGTEKAAELFVKKLSTKGIVTEVKKRTSKTVKGRTSQWYQVVTSGYSNKSDLITVVDRLVKEERLKDVCIQVC